MEADLRPPWFSMCRDARPRECFGLWCLEGAAQPLSWQPGEPLLSARHALSIRCPPPKPEPQPASCQRWSRGGGGGENGVQWGHGGGGLLMGWVSSWGRAPERPVSMGPCGRQCVHVQEERLLLRSTREWKEAGMRLKVSLKTSSTIFHRAIWNTYFNFFHEFFQVKRLVLPQDCWVLYRNV